MQEMELPSFYGLIKLISTIGAIIGCISGGFMVIGSLAAFKWGLFQGLIAISGGVMIVTSALVGLGLIFCFLSIVQAQIDTRNMTLRLLNKQD